MKAGSYYYLNGTGYALHSWYKTTISMNLTGIFKLIKTGNKKYIGSNKYALRKVCVFRDISNNSEVLVLKNSYLLTRKRLIPKHKLDYEWTLLMI